MTQRIIRLPQVIDRVGLARPTIYRYIRAGLFPKQIKIGRQSGWIESEIESWINERMQDRCEPAYP